MIDSQIACIAMVGTLFGTAILAIGIAAAVRCHPGGSSGPFRLRNHFASELGWMSRSPMARVFNACICVGSLFFAPVLCSLWLYFRTPLSLIATCFGLASITAASAVGLLPMDHFKTHLAATISSFATWLVAAGLFTIEFWRNSSGGHSMPMVAVGIATLISCISLLLFPKDSLIAAVRAVQHNQAFQRPGIWWLAVIEWTVVFCMWLWMLAATGFIWSACSR